MFVSFLQRTGDEEFGAGLNLPMRGMVPGTPTSAHHAEALPGGRGTAALRLRAHGSESLGGGCTKLRYTETSVAQALWQCQRTHAPLLAEPLMFCTGWRTSHDTAGGWARASRPALPEGSELALRCCKSSSFPGITKPFPL